MTGLVSETYNQRMTFHTGTFSLERISFKPLWVRADIQANRERERKREKWGGMSEERRGTEWERKRASWHLRDHINSLNRCDIIIKLAGVLCSPHALHQCSLSSPNHWLFLRPLFKCLEKLWQTQRGLAKKIQSAVMYPRVTALLLEQH